MRKLFRNIGFLSLCLISYTSQSQDLLSAEAAVANALQNNYEIILLRNDSALAALNNSYANAALLPRLNASTGIIFNNNNTRQKLADGTEKKKGGIRSNNLAAALNLNWTIFDGLKMFATKDKLAEFGRTKHQKPGDQHRS
jgi:outer membrane protein TolC